MGRGIRASGRASRSWPVSAYLLVLAIATSLPVVGCAAVVAYHFVAESSQLMKAEYDDTPLAIEADERIRTFQADSAKRAGIFHHLITLPTYHTAALSTDNLAREYFGEQGMLGYVKNVQRAEIRQGIACVKHQNMAGSDIGDDHKEYFAGEAALKAGGAHNTMNQFG